MQFATDRVISRGPAQPLQTTTPNSAVQKIFPTTLKLYKSIIMPDPVRLELALAECRLKSNPNFTEISSEFSVDRITLSRRYHGTQ